MRALCSINECGRKVVARGYCDTHYRRLLRHGDTASLHRSTCTIEGCVGQHQAKGLCSRHYKKLRKYGDPLHCTNADKGEQLRWLNSLVRYQGDDCVLWRFSTYSNGYGCIWFEGRLTGAHRLMCRLAHGAPSAANLQAAHGCGKQLCINPNHLRWATQAENEQDKYAHGTRRRAILKGEQR